MKQSQKEKELTNFIDSLNLDNEKADKIIAVLRMLVQQQNK
jgi:endonuclease III